MTIDFKHGLGAALVFISTAQMAQAQVTAQEVWADWKNYMSGYGYEVSATENMSGNTLSVSDMKMSMQMPQDEGTISMEMASLVFTTNGDGTVTVGMSSTMPLRITGNDDGADFEVVLNYVQNGNSLVVSGSPDDLNYNYTASQVDLTLASLQVDGQMLPPEVARATITMTNVISSTQMKLGAIRDYSQRMSVDSLSYDMAFDDPESDDNGAMNGSVLGLSFQGGGKIPLDMDPDDFPAMMAAGFAFDGLFEYASGSSSLSGKGDGEEFAFNSTSQGGRLGMAMDARRLSYDVNQKGTSINVTTSQLPFPVSMEMSEAGFKVDMPVAQSNQDQDFSFAMVMRDFKVSDMIWGMVDPAQVLPRDPATFVFDVSGKARVLANILDPDMAENLNAPPGELNALTINELLVSAAGAKLSGTGDFTFDNSDLTSFDGIPAPTGVANLALSGANGLIGKLIEMGLMAESDAMGARMMMGMLAVPGEGADSLKSTIEITGDGQIIANGQRIK